MDGATGYGGGGSSHSNQGFNFDQRGTDEFGQQDGSRSRSMLPPQHRQQGDFSGLPSLSESELVDAFAGFDLDDATRAAVAQRLQAGRQGGADALGPGFNAQAGGLGKRSDPFSGGYNNRDPNGFMFSPFSPSDSPIVGGKADLPNSHSSSSSLHLSHRVDDDASSEAPPTASANR